MNKFLFYTHSVFLTGIVCADDGKDGDRPPRPNRVPVCSAKELFAREFGFNHINYEGDVQQYFLPTALLKYGLSQRMVSV